MGVCNTVIYSHIHLMYTHIHLIYMLYTAIYALCTPIYTLYYNSINTVPQVKSKTICFSSLTYISAVLNGLHQGEWPLQASHNIIT